MKHWVPTISVLLLALGLGCAEQQNPPVPPPPKPPPATGPMAKEVPTVTPDAPFRAKAPAPGPDIAFRPPTIEEAKLSNGARVLLVERHELPIVAIQIAFDRGADQAPPVIGAMTGALLMSGTAKRTALQLTEAFEELGAEHSAWTDYDASQIYVKVLSSQTKGALEILGDILQNASFPRDELKREKSRWVTSFRQESDSPRRILSRTVAEILYGKTHPYGSMLTGTDREIELVQRSQLSDFFRRNMQPDRATIAVSGDIKKADLMALLEQTLGSWKGKSKGRLTIKDPKITSKSPMQVVVVDRKGASQTNVAVVQVGVPRKHKDFDALVLMNTILGGQFTSRLNLNLREKHAYTYGSGSNFSMRLGAGPFQASAAVKSSVTKQALTEMMNEINRIRREKVTVDELQRARNYLIRQLPARFESTPQTAGTLAALSIYGLPLDEFTTRKARFEKVTPEDILRVAMEHLQPGEMKVVMVGDAQSIKTQFKDSELLKNMEVRETPKSKKAVHQRKHKKP
jgi:zinc protease